jgi:hypothetical protein
VLVISLRAAEHGTKPIRVMTVDQLLEEEGEE